MVHYITEGLDGARQPLALDFDATGDAKEREPLPSAGLPATRWRVAREAVSDPHTCPKVTESLEDTPFYSRQRLRHWVDGEHVDAIHESLDLNRFRKRWVRFLLPFKTRRH